MLPINGSTHMIAVGFCLGIFPDGIVRAAGGPGNLELSHPGQGASEECSAGLLVFDVFLPERTCGEV